MDNSDWVSKALQQAYMTGYRQQWRGLSGSRFSMKEAANWGGLIGPVSPLWQVPLVI
jgi:hypothetical protein